MVEVMESAAEAAFKVKNLADFERRVEEAAVAVERLLEGREAAILIYEAALAKSGRSREEIRATTDRFRKTFHDPEESYTIPRVSGLMGVQSDEWFFGDADLRTLTGLLLGQFQHRVAQYNYLQENEVLRRWADAYDTRLFIRRRIYDTEPVVGVVAGFDLAGLQNLRVLCGGNTLVPSPALARALARLGFPEGDPYETVARGEALAMQLELPAPLVAEVLEGLERDGVSDFPEPPAREPEEDAEGTQENSGEEA